MSKRPVVALVATPKFKMEHKDRLCTFVLQNLHLLTSKFDVISTGKTYAEIKGFLPETPEALQKLKDDHQIPGDLWLLNLSAAELKKWRDSINNNFQKRKVGVLGVIEIAHQLIQGKLDAVIHLGVDDDTTARAGSAVLLREANVHNVPIALNIPTARTFVKFWNSPVGKPDPKPAELFGKETPKNLPPVNLNGTAGGVALIAHDGQKVALTQFVMEHSEDLQQFSRILATGHSGEIVQRCLLTRHWNVTHLSKIHRYKPGPNGGDVEIAAEVIRGACDHVLFFQDPGFSQPHQADIRLFEQAVLASVGVLMATNSASARILLSALRFKAGEAPVQPDRRTSRLPIRGERARL
jgi:methylglyoxal synthase